MHAGSLSHLSGFYLSNLELACVEPDYIYLDDAVLPILGNAFLKLTWFFGYLTIRVFLDYLSCLLKAVFCISVLKSITKHIKELGKSYLDGTLTISLPCT